MEEIKYANTIKIKVIKESMVAGNSSSITSIERVRKLRNVNQISAMLPSD